MIELRNFRTDDTYVLQRNRYNNLSNQEILELIYSWNEKLYEGKYYEMFAIVDGQEIVGSISLYQHTNYIISCGPFIYLEYRQRNYAYHAVNDALHIAKNKGYKIAVAQIRSDNVASIALHAKLGFEKECTYINNKGNEVHCYLKSLL